MTEAGWGSVWPGHHQRGRSPPDRREVGAVVVHRHGLEGSRWVRPPPYQ